MEQVSFLEFVKNNLQIFEVIALALLIFFSAVVSHLISKSKESKKMTFIAPFSVSITLAFVFMGMMLFSSYNRYLKDLEKQQINLFDLRLKEIDTIEFPNQISDFDKELTIPFELQVRAKTIKMKFFILEDDRKPCNISKSIYNLTPCIASPGIGQPASKISIINF